MHKQLAVPCPRCAGHGTVPLPSPLAALVAVIEGTGPAPLGVLHARLPAGYPLMTLQNQLLKLVSLGVLGRARHVLPASTRGAQWLYFIPSTDPALTAGSTTHKETAP